MIALVAHLTRGWCRMWLTGPLRAVDGFCVACCRDFSLVLVRQRRSPRG
jgi:hypothetical protein